jgi:hypothetical protein
MVPNNRPAEETLRVTLDAAIKGDTLKAIQGLTTDATEDLRHVGRSMAGFSRTRSYDVEELKRKGKDHPFLVRLRTPEQEADVRITLREFRAGWKITGIQVIESHDAAKLLAETPEDCLRYTCEAAFRGDGQTLSDQLTSEAFVDMLRLGTAWGLLPAPDTYTIVPNGHDSEDLRFLLNLKNGAHEIELNASVRQVQGVWKVSALKLPGVRD